MSSRKVASLSGELLLRGKSNFSTGFVLSADEKTQTPDRTPETPRSAVRTVPTADAVAPVRERAPDPDEAPLPPAATSIDRKEDPRHRGERRGTLRPSFPGEPGAAAVGIAEDVTVQHLLHALRQGVLSDAEALFGRLTGLDHAQVQRVLYGPTARHLAVACRAIAMEQLQFVSIFILTRKLGLGREALEPQKLARAVAHFEGIDEAEAKKVLKNWQRNSIEALGDHVDPDRSSESRSRPS